MGGVLDATVRNIKRETKCAGLDVKIESVVTPV